MKQLYNISDLHFETDYLIIKVDDLVYKLKISDLSDRLALATEEEKNEYEISPSGYGIHWPKIDEDLSIQNMINNYLPK